MKIHDSGVHDARNFLPFEIKKSIELSKIGNFFINIFYALTITIRSLESSYRIALLNRHFWPVENRRGQSRKCPPPYTPPWQKTERRKRKTKGKKKKERKMKRKWRENSKKNRDTIRKFYKIREFYINILQKFSQHEFEEILLNQFKNVMWLSNPKCFEACFNKSISYYNLKFLYLNH